MKKSKALNHDSFIFHWKKYHRKKKLRPISHEKKTHMGKSCVIMTDLMIKFYLKTELSDEKTEKPKKDKIHRVISEKVT